MQGMKVWSFKGMQYDSLYKIAWNVFAAYWFASKRNIEDEAITAYF